jgi:hypothetical protein
VHSQTALGDRSTLAAQAATRVNIARHATAIALGPIVISRLTNSISTFDLGRSAQARRRRPRLKLARVPLGTCETCHMQ